MEKKKLFLFDADFVQRRKAEGTSSIGDASSAKGKSGPGVRLIFKDESGKTVRAFDSSFEPYFYLLPSQGGVAEAKKRCEAVKAMPRGNAASAVKAKRIEETRILVNGAETQILRVVCEHPGHVPALREAFAASGVGRVFEADIPFVRRYLYDKAIYPSSWVEAEIDGATREIKINSVRNLPGAEQSADPQLRLLAFDIEVRNPRGVTDAKRDECTMISYAALQGDDGKIDAAVISRDKKFSAPFVEKHKNEKEMLEAFGALLHEKSPDLLCTYNGDVFDVPFLTERARQTRAQLFLGRTKREARTKRLGLRSVTAIPGRVHYDVFAAVSFLNTIGAIRLPRLTLERAYEEVLGKKKPGFDKPGMWKVWDAGETTEVDRMAEYCKSDSIACLELGVHFLPLELALSRVSGVPFADASRATTGQLVEALLIREAFARNEIVPNKPEGSEAALRANNPIQGAFVATPEAGVYENIAVLDFRSLYPSIIISHNVDPATLNCDCCGAEGAAFVSPQGHCFCAKRRGIIPETLNKVIDERVALKKKMKALDKNEKNDKNEKSTEYSQLDARQWALKIIANSVAPDEFIVLLTPQNEVVVQTASEFVDSRLSNEFIHSTQLGDAAGWRTACFNKLGRVVFKPIKKVMRHKADSLLNVRLASGREVKITRNHSVFTIDEAGCFSPIAGCDLKTGTPVLVPKKAPSPDKLVRRINLLKVLSNVPLEEAKNLVVTLKFERSLDVLEIDALLLDSLEEKQMVSSAAEPAGVGRRCAGSHLRHLKDAGLVSCVSKGRSSVYQVTDAGRTERDFLKTVLPKLKYNGNKREHFLNYAEVKNIPDKVKESPRWNNAKIGALNGARISVFVPFNENVARLLGYFVSEGHARKWVNASGGSSYRAAVTNLDDKILDFCGTAMNALGLETQKLTQDVTSNTQMAFLLFKYAYECGANAFEKQVPPLVLTSPREIKMAFLKTYFEGDGNYEKKARRWRFTTVSRKLATTLCLLLSQLGFCASIKNDSRFYRIVVNDALFGGDRKLYRTFSFGIPGRLLEKEVRLLAEKRFYRRLRSRMDKKTLELFANKFEKKFGKNDKLSNLLLLLDSDLAVDEIAEISEEKPPEFVYDLSVDEDENFIGGFGLVCLHNSFYGYLGYSRSRWYSREAAESVTAWARQYIHETIDKAKEAGFKVLYTDTDSVFLLYEKGKEEKVRDFQKKINSELPEKMELELEDFYPRGIFVAKKQENEKNGRGAKKKYALINRDGKIKIRGFELVRRDWSRVARNTQREVLRILLSEGDVRKAVDVVRATIARLKAGEVPLEECVVYTQLQKSTASYEIKSPELSAVLHGRKAGLSIPEGSVVAYVITKKGNSISEKAQVAELARDYDADYYINNQIMPAVLKILGALGVDKEDIKTKGTQARLGGW